MTLPARKVGDKVMTPRPLLLCSRLWALPGSCSRGLPLGGSGRLRAPRSTQEPGEGAEARVRLRLRWPELLPACRRGRPRGGEGRGGARRWQPGEPDTPALVYLDALGEGGTGLQERARRRLPRRERLPRAAGPARAGCAVSRCAGRLARAPRGPSTSSLSASLTLTAPSEHPGCGARPAPGPRPPRPTPRAPPAGAPSTRALARVSQRRGGAGPRARGRQSTWRGQSVYLRVTRRTHLSCCNRRASGFGELLLT